VVQQRRTVPLLWVVVGAAALVLLLGGVAGAALLLGGDDDDGPSSSVRASDRAAQEARDADSPDDVEVPEPDEFGDLGDDPQLDALAEECFDGDPSACDDLYRDSDVGSDYEEYGGTCGGRTSSGQLGGCHERYPDPDFADLRDQCGGGDDAACDELYTLSPDRSLDEEYGSTCGGRSEDELAGRCEAEGP
jgi:hypothetical protein